MPRLLLVDDNPSIHKIAETLLATTDVELVCVDSAAAAIARVESAEVFDAALLDTNMLGMDGWQLLERLRRHPSTARIPIAMMAGVLDEVDPARIQAAPIQAFLKKPVELRDLGQRVHQLMQATVPEAPAAPPPPPPLPEAAEASPFATVPAARIEDLGVAFPAGPPESDLDEEADLLKLTEEDLFPEELEAELAESATFAATPHAVPEIPLELEELDLEGLRSLAPVGAPASADSVPEASIESEPASELEPEPVLPFLPPAEGWQVAPSAAPAVVTAELPDLGEAMETPTGLEGAVAGAATGTTDGLAAPVPEGSITEDLLSLEDWATPAAEVVPIPPDMGPTLVLEDEAILTQDLEGLGEPALDSALAAVPTPLGVAALPAAALPAKDELDLGEESSVIVPSGFDAIPVPTGFPLEPTVSGPAIPALPQPPELPEVPPAPAIGASPAAVPMPDVTSLAQALAQDPTLVDALARAVVARLGDKVLREIAWEVMPDLAERLRRP